MLTLAFASGTLELRGSSGADAERLGLATEFSWDPRTRCLRAPAVAYAAAVRALARSGVAFEDHARSYVELALSLRLEREPRPYQRVALASWIQRQGRGVVVLPTGAGKTHLAVLGILAKQRSALVITPTLDLVRQWYDVLRASYGEPVGVMGGGEHEVLPLTVSTYDSAYLHMENVGQRFGMVVFDECHHLPSASYALAAEMCIAPFRLGLTATPERADGREAVLDRLIGPVVHRSDILELSGEYLAEYETVKVTVALAAAERTEYEAERKLYLEFVRSQGIRMGSPRGWSDFIVRAARSREGQRAFRAYRRQRELAFNAKAKLEYLAELLLLHRADRMIVFTQDNATAYEVARRFLVPVITHQTKVKERSEILQRFARGEYTAVVTSKVLNEGVDVPEANVAVILSGSGSVREHVQRLGRILRPAPDKRAILYEVVTASTGETFTSDRRRDHDAYQR
jgi:superfamily II DNA or RNA helicase